MEKLEINWNNDSDKGAEFKIHMGFEYPDQSKVFKYIGCILNDKETLYFAENWYTGICNYFLHDKDRETGYGGHVFELKMVDKTIQKIKGPWSSRAGVVNAVLKAIDYPCQVIDVTLIEPEGGAVSGCVNYITLASLLPENVFLKETILSGLRLGEVIYEPVKV